MAINVTSGNKAQDDQQIERRIKLNERILRALYNVAVDAQLDYEDTDISKLMPWEESSRGYAFVELQEAISELLYELADEDDSSTWFADELY